MKNVVAPPPGPPLDLELVQTLLPEAVAGVARLERRPAAYRSSAHLEELDVHLMDGSTLELMFKASGHGPVPLPGSGPDDPVRPEFVRDATREAAVYAHVLHPEGMAVPKLHAVRVDPAGQWSWLLIERVRGRALWQHGELATWCEVARWLARHHARFGRCGVPGKEARLLRQDRDHHGRWLERAIAFASAGDHRRHDVLGSVADRYDEVLDCLDAVPETFAHGEFFPANVLIRDLISNGSRVCVVDWESGAHGPCLQDLAALTSGKWARSDCLAMEAAYLEALHVGQWWTPDARSFGRLLAAARIQLAIVQLGWCSGWSPPPEHKHDWVGVVEESLEEVSR